MDERMKTVFTTGEAAKICKVSQQTIIRCFDNGQLKGFRVPGSRFRRIPREARELNTEHPLRPAMPVRSGTAPRDADRGRSGMMLVPDLR